MRSIYIKRICYILIILSVFTTNIFASSLSSGNYVVEMPRLVSGGGSATSLNYSIQNVCIGPFTGGVSQSANYTLDMRNTYIVDIDTAPNPPILNPIISPTNVQIQTLSGSKDPGTAIYINGFVVFYSLVEFLLKTGFHIW